MYIVLFISMYILNVAILYSGHIYLSLYISLKDYHFQGRRIYKQKGIEIWARPILPVYRSKYSYGIVFLNRRTDGTPSEVNYYS